MKDDFGNEWKGSDYIMAIITIIGIIVLICIPATIYTLIYFGLDSIKVDMNKAWLPLTLIFMLLCITPGIFSKQIANYIWNMSNKYERRIGKLK